LFAIGKSTRPQGGKEADMERTPLSAISRQIRPVNTSHLLAAIALSLSSTSACHKVNSPNQSKSFVVEKEVLLNVGKPEALTRTTSGGFVVVGEAASAWAAASDANGQFQWKYSVPTDPNVQFLIQSTFHGVVPLPSGGVLACGELFTADNRQTAIVVTLDSHGKLVEQRTITPKDDPTVRSSSFLTCATWGDGFVLTGRWYDEGKRQAYYWLVKLDKNGAREWEKLGEELPGFDGVVTADQNLTLVGIPVNARTVRIARFNPKGDVVATRMTAFREARAVRSEEPTNEVKVIGVDSGTNNVLLSLTGDLRDTRTPKHLDWLSVREGCAYLLHDGSVALFGNKFAVGAVYRASVAWLDRQEANDQIETMGVPDPKDSSFTVADAVPISPHQFVALRDLESGANATHNGSILFWVNF
jgi:hypothetical protein